MTFSMLNCIMSLDKILSEELNSTDQSIEACLKEIEEVLEGIGSRCENGKGENISDEKSKNETNSVKKDVQTKRQRSCLSKVVACIHYDVGCLEQLLSHLEELRRQCGLELITSTCLCCSFCSERVSSDIPSLSAEKATEALWNCICFHVESYINSHLQSVLTGDSGYSRLVKKAAFRYYLKIICSVLDATSVWDFHRRLRRKQLKLFKCPCIEASEELSCCLFCLLSFCLHCIIEDLEMVCIGYFQPLVVTWTEVQRNYTEFIEDHVSSILRVLDGLRQEQKTWPDIVKLIFCLKEKNQCFMNRSQEQQSDSVISEEDLETLIFEEKDVFVDTVEQDRLSVEVHPGSGKSRTDRWNGKSFKSTKGKGSLVSKGSLSVIMNDTYLDTRKSSLTLESGKKWTTKFNEKNGHMGIFQLTDIILNMVEAFLKFEEQINLLYTGGPVCDDSNFAAESICFQLLGGVNSSFPDESPKQSPFHQTKTTSYGNENCASLSWDWRSCLVESGYLNILQRTLQHSIQEIIQEEIHLEWERFNRGEELPKREVYMNTSERIKDRKAVLRSVLNFVKELCKYIPAVEAGQGAFVPFCASFVHTVHSYTSDILHHMEQISLWVPHETSVTTLYVLLNTAVYLEFNLKIWSNVLSEGNNNRFHFSVEAVLNNTAGLVTALHDRIIHYHMKLLRCGILQDVDSHNWHDLKPFFEGERVSFTVQMWNFYMRGLVYDLWKFLTASRSQVILGTILVETLKQFSIQYVNALPSDVRTAQMKADITAILLSVSYILSSVCSKDSEMFGRVSCFQNSHTPQYVTLIHSHCSRLLLILAVVTSPLRSLYKVFKKGFPIQTSSEQLKKPVINPWLTWLCPTLFSNDCQSPLMSSVSVWLYVKLCVSQPVPSADLICKVLSLHDCTLSTLLVIQSAHGSEKEKTKLVQTIFLVLRCCDHAPDGLGGVFWSAIQKYKGWMEFDKSRFTAQLSERPWWYNAFQKILFPFYKRMLRCVLPDKLVTLSSNRSSQHSAWLDLKQDLLDTFTCTCQPHLAETPPDNINILGIACLSILSNVIDLIPFLPQPFLVCMTLLDLWLPGCEIPPIPLYGCAGLQVLISGLCGVLKDPEFLHEVFETNVDNSTQKLCTQLAETLEKLVAPTFITSEIHIPQDYTDKAREQLMCMKKLFEPKSESQKDTNEDTEEYCYQEVEEMRIHFMTSQLLQDPKGPEAVNYLFDLLHTNLKWIRKSLGISSILSTNDVLNRITPSPHTCSERNSTDKSTKSSFTKGKEVSQNTQSAAADAKAARKKKSSESESIVEGSSGTRRSSWEDFKLEHLNTMLSHISEEEKEDVKYDLILSREGKTDETFNPMEEYQLIGDSYFDQKALADFPFRWEDLLHQTPQLGLTNISFTNLLSHRWDIRGVTPVASSQEKYIQVLKTTYDISNVQSNENVM